MQYVKSLSALVSGALMLAYIFPQSFWGISSGFYVSWTNHYKVPIVSRPGTAGTKGVQVVGTLVWTLSLGLQLLWRESTSVGVIIGMLELGAIGIGFNLQNSG